MLTFNPNEAAGADRVSSAIKESGLYVGVITRAEKIVSSTGTQGLGLSFKADSGQSADYLDLYTNKADGTPLPSSKTVQAILGCLQLRGANDGQITCEKYNKASGQREKVQVPGYPELMGKRIGLLLQTELGTNSNTGADTERIVIYGVFQADSRLTISEILARKTTPETLDKMIASMPAVRDNRKNKSHAPAHSGGNEGYGFNAPPQGDDYPDIPF